MAFFQAQRARTQKQADAAHQSLVAQSIQKSIPVAEAAANARANFMKAREMFEAAVLEKLVWNCSRDVALLSLGCRWLPSSLIGHALLTENVALPIAGGATRYLPLCRRPVGRLLCNLVPDLKQRSIATDGTFADAS